MKGSRTFFFTTSNLVLGLKMSAVVYVAAEKHLALFACVSTHLWCMNDHTKHARELFSVFIIPCSVFLGIPRQSTTLRHSKNRKRKGLKGPIGTGILPFSLVLAVVWTCCIKNIGSAYSSSEANTFLRCSTSKQFFAVVLFYPVSVLWELCISLYVDIYI